MPDKKRLIVGIGCRDGKAVSLDGQKTAEDLSFSRMTADYNDLGADGLLFWDLSENDEDHERCIGQLREIARTADIPLLAGGRVRRLEDVKKYLYAGARAVFLDGPGPDGEREELIREAAGRFGAEKLWLWQPGTGTLRKMASGNEDEPGDFLQICKDVSAAKLKEILSDPGCEGAVLDLLSVTAEDHGQPLPILEWKQGLADSGIPADTLVSTIPFSQFKTGADGLIPVIVQDYKTDQVLMLAYMNEQAFQDTLRTGRMHYYSRSRRTQWLKGETSGHFQYVKSLRLDCDNDTLLARVRQIGAACHTGERSCFFKTLAEKETKETNPLKVFEDVFAVIQDRKVHPREGSYTNYLFDKGIDKILKKVGEEATEIVIAAKNPDPEEIKYEISDFLYHVMVLMAEKGVTWEEITEELANR